MRRGVCDKSFYVGELAVRREVERVDGLRFCRICAQGPGAEAFLVAVAARFYARFPAVPSAGACPQPLGGGAWSLVLAGSEPATRTETAARARAPGRRPRTRLEHPWTAEDRAQLKALYAEGGRAACLSYFTHRSVHAVDSAVKRLGLRRGRRAAGVV